jgi:hypothetical protein
VLKGHFFVRRLVLTGLSVSLVVLLAGCTSTPRSVSQTSATRHGWSTVKVRGMTKLYSGWGSTSCVSANVCTIIGYREPGLAVVNEAASWNGASWVLHPMPIVLGIRNAQPRATGLVWRSVSRDRRPASGRLDASTRVVRPIALG